eukprot:RCo018587
MSSFLPPPRVVREYEVRRVLGPRVLPGVPLQDSRPTPSTSVTSAAHPQTTTAPPSAHPSHPSGTFRKVTSPLSDSLDPLRAQFPSEEPHLNTAVLPTTTATTLSPANAAGQDTGASSTTGAAPRPTQLSPSIPSAQEGPEMALVAPTPLEAQPPVISPTSAPVDAFSFSSGSTASTLSAPSSGAPHRPKGFTSPKLRSQPSPPRPPRHQAVDSPPSAPASGAAPGAWSPPHSFADPPLMPQSGTLSPRAPSSPSSVMSGDLPEPWPDSESMANLLQQGPEVMPWDQAFRAPPRLHPEELLSGYSEVPGAISGPSAGEVSPVYCSVPGSSSFEKSWPREFPRNPGQGFLRRLSGVLFSARPGRARRRSPSPSPSSRPLSPSSVTEREAIGGPLGPKDPMQVLVVGLWPEALAVGLSMAAHPTASTTPTPSYHTVLFLVTPEQGRELLAKKEMSLDVAGLVKPKGPFPASPIRATPVLAGRLTPSLPGDCRVGLVTNLKDFWGPDEMMRPDGFRPCFDLVVLAMPRTEVDQAVATLQPFKDRIRGLLSLQDGVLEEMRLHRALREASVQEVSGGLRRTVRNVVVSGALYGVVV